MRPDGQKPGPKGNKPKPPPPKPNMSPDEVMNRADANKDGAISLQEDIDFALKEADTRFSRMDRDHDGRVTSQELAETEKRRQSMNQENMPEAGGNGGRQPPSPQSLMTRADADHDGVVDRSENRALAKEQASRRFRFGDKNGDGRLERSEMQAKPQAPAQ
jgi:Ca2+-binding EF-hand superfamily protein